MILPNLFSVPDYFMQADKTPQQPLLNNHSSTTTPQQPLLNSSVILKHNVMYEEEIKSLQQLVSNLTNQNQLLQGELSNLSQQLLVSASIPAHSEDSSSSTSNSNSSDEIIPKTVPKRPNRILIEPTSRAPWDPIMGIGQGGHTLFQKRCHAELDATGCKDSLPLDVCLRMKLNEMNVPISDSCSFLLDPCQPNRKYSQECKDYEIFKNMITNEEKEQLDSLLTNIEKASSLNGQILDCWMAAGSGIGGLVHHGRIPWDDDIDFYVRKEHLDTLLENIKSLGLAIGWTGLDNVEKYAYKIYNQTFAEIPGHEHTYPFLDFFPVDCSDGLNCVEFNSEQKWSAPVDSIFPLKRRPFGRLSMLFPAKARTIVENRYGPDFKKVCMREAYDHRHERFLGRRNRHRRNCTDLVFPPPFVYDQFDAITTNHTSFTPWKEDFPDITVEHILNDEGERLSSVVFDDGNEIRRSYADGLLHVDGNVITHSFASLLPSNHQQKLVPFLYEERTSFLVNKAGRSAEEINKEVLPVLDRVIISNKYGTASYDTKSNRLLQVGEWNAARGHNWDVFPDFYPTADIIILNEMDLGMARSGNTDITKAMADSVKMNYAFGVEFLELTNGNEEEINVTIGERNLIGYHGNVVLTRWPIIESKVVRLHPLYDLLLEEKTSGMAKGERRLGGRMALFTLIQTSHFGDILAISIHAHSGSKQNLLKQDAQLVCDEINKYSTKNVIIGGDIAAPIPQTLITDCGFFEASKTNSKSGSRLTPSWRLECPNGGMPRTARYPTRGDFILVKGPGFDVDSSITKADTLYPFRKHEGDKPDSEPWYECVSDHALLTLDIAFTK